METQFKLTPQVFNDFASRKFLNQRERASTITVKLISPDEKLKILGAEQYRAPSSQSLRNTGPV